MSIQAIAWVLENSQSELADRLVLMALANHADASWTCFPSVQRIAAEAGVSARQVYRSLNDLSIIGEIQVTRGGGRGRHNTYQIAPQKHCQIVTVNQNLTVTGCLETVTDGHLNPDTVSPSTVINRHEPSRARARDAREALQEWTATGELEPLSFEEKTKQRERLKKYREGA